MLKEADITTQALEQLKAILPLKHLHVRREVKEPNSNRVWDGDITFETNDKKIRFIFEVKKHVQPHTVNHLLVQAAQTKHLKTDGLLLLADYINPSVAQMLKQSKINFIDTAGNLFVNVRNLHVSVEGKRARVLSVMKPPRVWGNTGLRLLYTLLLHPEAINQPYRHLASSTDVSLGAIGWIIRDLKEGGYLHPTAKDEFKLVRRKELMMRWVEEYGAKLRPRLVINSYRSFAQDEKEVLPAFRNFALVHGIQWALTGGVAADEVIHHYRGPYLTVFVSDWIQDSALKDLNWAPIEGGPITLLRAFSSQIFNDWTSNSAYPVAHPLLIYAELVYGGGERELETARLIYSEYLEPIFGKD